MGGGGPQTQSSTTTTKLPADVQPYVDNFLQTAQNTVAPNNQITSYPYPNQQVAPLTGMQMSGLNAIQNMGTQSPLVNQAMQMQSDVMGQNAINNPLLSQYFNQAAGDVTGQMNAAMLKSGAFGSSGAVDATGKTLNNLATQIYEPAWNQQEQLKQQAAYMSPYLMQSSYFPAQMQMNAGGQEQAQAQNILNTGYQNQYNQAQWPFNALQMLQGYLSAGSGAGGTQTVNVKAS